MSRWFPTLVIGCLLSGQVAVAQTTSPETCDPSLTTCMIETPRVISKAEGDPGFTPFDEIKEITEAPRIIPTEAEQDWMQGLSSGSASLFDISR